MIRKPLWLQDRTTLARQQQTTDWSYVYVLCHNIAYLRQVLQYFGLGIVIMISKTTIGLRQFSHTINWSL
jgi:hypothetical protein